MFFVNQVTFRDVCFEIFSQGTCRNFINEVYNSENNYMAAMKPILIGVSREISVFLVGKKQDP